MLVRILGLANEVKGVDDALVTDDNSLVFVDDLNFQLIEFCCFNLASQT